MCLHFSETTLKTILGTIPKYSIENFSFRTIFSNTYLLFTTHIYICYQIILKTFLFRIFRFWPCSCIFGIIPEFALNLGITLAAVLSCTKFLLPYVSSSSQNCKLNYYFNVSSRLLYSSRVFSAGFRLPMYIASIIISVSTVRQASRIFHSVSFMAPRYSTRCWPTCESFFWCSVILVVTCRLVCPT